MHELSMYGYRVYNNMVLYLKETHLPSSPSVVRGAKEKPHTKRILSNREIRTAGPSSHPP